MLTFFEPYAVEIRVIIGTLLLATIVVLGLGVKEYKTKYEAELQTVATLNQRIAQSDTELKVCSDNIQALSVESAEKLKAAQIASDEASAKAKKYQSYANRLLTAVPASTNQCDSTLVLFNEYLANLKDPK